MTLCCSADVVVVLDKINEYNHSCKWPLVSVAHQNLLYATEAGSSLEAQKLSKNQKEQTHVSQAVLEYTDGLSFFI